MKVAIIITTPDFAGLNIKERLLENYEFVRLNKRFDSHEIYEYGKGKDIKIYTTDKRCVYMENIDKDIDAGLFLIPTTHRSGAGVKSLSLHTQGNWAKAELGGKDRTLGIAPAIYLKEFFIELNRQGKDLGYEITLECTHHGPEINKPSVFLEIGTSEEQWKDRAAGLVIAKTIMSVLTKKYDEKNYTAAFGIGGPHYCNNFNRIILESNIAIGHICPKHMLDKLDREMVLQAIEKTAPKPGLAVLDWKGLGAEKGRIAGLLDELKISYKRTKEF